MRGSGRGKNRSSRVALGEPDEFVLRPPPPAGNSIAPPTAGLRTVRPIRRVRSGGDDPYTQRKTRVSSLNISLPSHYTHYYCYRVDAHCVSWHECMHGVTRGYRTIYVGGKSIFLNVRRFPV